MKKIARVVSCLALAATLVPAVLFFSDAMALPAARLWMLVGALVWFVAAPFWMEHKATD